MTSIIALAIINSSKQHRQRRSLAITLSWPALRQG
nr:MAG TPA: hypothetical protein [Caudoviricetes sp.]